MATAIASGTLNVYGHAMAILNKRQREASAKEARAHLDYNGMSLEEWKAALKTDVEARFGPTPEDLVPASKSGW